MEENVEYLAFSKAEKVGVHVLPLPRCKQDVNIVISTNMHALKCTSLEKQADSLNGHVNLDAWRNTRLEKALDDSRDLEILDLVTVTCSTNVITPSL